MSSRVPAAEKPAPDRAVDLGQPEPVGRTSRGRLLPALVPAMISAVSGYVVLAALRGRLGAEDYSSVAALMACAVILSVPGAVFQVSKSPSARRTSDQVGRPRRSTALSRTLAILVAASFLILALAPALDDFLHLRKGSSGLLAPTFLLSSVAGVAIGASRRHLDVVRYAALAVARLLVGIALGLVFVHLGLGLAGMLLALLTAEAAVLLLLATSAVIRSLRPRAVRTEASLLPELDPAHAGIAGALIGSLWLFAHFDVVLARHYLPAIGANYYCSAWTISRLFLGPVALIAVSMFRSSPKRTLPASAWLLRLLGITWGIPLGSVAILLALRHQAESLVFGPSFEPADRLLPTFALAMGLFAAASVLAQFNLIARSRVFLLLLPVMLLGVVLASRLHNDDELVLVAAGTMALAAAALYAAGTSIFRWSRPVGGGLSPYEELTPAAGATVDRSPVELSLVLPCHNSGPQLEAFIGSLWENLDPRVPTEIIVVSDGSTDDTVRVAADFASESIRVFHYPDRLGKGHALRVGLNQARGDYVAFIDSDGDVDPEAIVPFFSLMKLHQPDIVLGSKRHPMSRVDYPGLRRFLSWVYHIIGRVLFGIKVRDTQTGLKLIRRDVLAAVLPRMFEKRYAFDLELLVVARSLGFARIFEAPVKIHYRFSSNVNPTAAFLILLDTTAIFYRRYILNSYSPAAPLIETAFEAEQTGIDVTLRRASGIV